jgi:hypothetical protein
VILCPDLLFGGRGALAPAILLAVAMLELITIGDFVVEFFSGQGVPGGGFAGGNVAGQDDDGVEGVVLTTGS